MGHSISSRAPATAAAGLAVVSLVPVLLHQLRVIRHLPDPPFDIFDSDRITGSKSAYPMRIPDSLLGIGSYGLSMALLLHPSPPKWWGIVARVKFGVDGALAAFNTVRQIVVFRRLCSWCLVTAAATAVMAPAGWRTFRNKV